MLNFDKNGLPIAYIKCPNNKNEQILYLNIENTGNPPFSKTQKKKQKGLIRPLCKYCKKDFYSNWDLKVHQNKSCKVKQFEDYMNSKKDIKNIMGTELIIDNNCILQPLPRKDRREILYIAGAQGSGKSYYASNYIKEYLKMFPNNDAILFSRVKKDKNFKDIKKIIRVKLDDNILNDPIDPKKELIRSITIFDDIETMDKNMQKYLENLRNDIIKNGRDQEGIGNDIYCICTNHQVTDYSKTRDLLNEATSLTIFPKSGSTYGIKRALKSYFGLDNNQIHKILNLPSRWVSIYSSYPQYVLYEKGAYLLSC
jgi:hypothetical protein